ncbi:MAG TPA: hypothetical protein VEY92_08635 [Pseudoxanthomonas sp.]|nr:hypothetical protein [Pseudoxanthomonas sp.]
MKLAALSIYRVGHRKVPHVPTREERMQAYNAARPVQFANDRFPARKDAHRDSCDYGYFSRHTYAELSDGF